MSSRKQRLDVGSSSEPNKPQKRRFDDVAKQIYLIKIVKQVKHQTQIFPLR